MADPLRTARAFHLRTFGSLTLSGRDDVTVLGRHGHHRRRLALLAVLAATGDRGWSRDQLLLFFWPEASQARARHSLDQLLYALRSSLGDELFDGTDPVRLTREVVTSDVDAFTDALDRGQLEEAVNLYRGPFLGGFHLDAAPEFDQWAESERARLGRLYLGALEQLAQAAESQGDQVSALAWWRKLVEADPVSSRSAAGLIRALMNAGDHAAALQFAGHYESVVARELNTSVGPAVASLVAEVRADARTESIATPRSPALAAHTADPPVPIESIGRVLPRRASHRPIVATGLLVALTVVVATGFWWRSAPARTSAPTPASSIAVLPFANVSGDPDDAPLADGISDEVSAALARMSTLRVIARQSSLAFANPGADTRAIAESLRVTLLLEGSFQRIGSRLRMQVRLVDAPSRTTRWAQTYEREYTDVFEVQSDIATAVAREIHLQLGAPGQPVKRLTQNIAAYELYLRGRDPVNLRSDSGPARGLALLREAVALDSTFAAAWAAMPNYYIILAARETDAQRAREMEEQALAIARKALALDPDLPHAHAGLGSALNVPFTHLRAAEASIRRAIALGGSPRVHEQLFRTLMWSGRYTDALEEALRGVDADPLSPTAAASLGEALCVNGRYAEGQKQLERLTTLKTPLLRVRPILGLCAGMQGRWTEAVAYFEPGTGTSWWAPMLGFAVARSGDLDRARRMMALAEEQWRQTGHGATRVAFIAAGLRDYDRAFEWLDRAGPDRSMTASVMYPVFRELHADPRFERYRQRVGLQKR